MKTLSLLFFTLLISSFVGAQVMIDTPEYDSLKRHGLLTNQVLIPNPYVIGVGGAPDHHGPSSTVKTTSCDCYQEPDATYTLALAPNDDGSSALIPIPFNFCMYGTTYNAIYINNNGNLTFQNTMGTFSATAFPSVGDGIVAPFWGDVDTRGGNGQVLYKITPTAVYVNWVDVGYYSMQGDKRNTFQVTITDGTDPAVQNGNVAFCYKDMQWTTGSASQGVNGFGGVPATAGANKGDGVSFFLISRFDHAGTDFDGALGNPDGISWLDYKSFNFDVCNSGNVPPIPDGVSACDTFKVCALGDTADISINFLSPEANQTTSITYNNGGLSTLQQVANISGNTASIILRAIGETATAGFYTITVTATDNAAPIAGVTNLSFVIQIDTASGSGLNPILTPLGGCDSVQLSVLNGPYDTYLWDDYTVLSTDYLDTAVDYGVTVSLNGCYKRVHEFINVMQPITIGLPGPFAFCPPSTSVSVEIPDSLYYSVVSWSQNSTVFDSTNYINVLGAGTYTIHLVDSAGYCSKDTTFTITTSVPPTIFGDTTACDMTFLSTGVTSTGGGVWTASSPNVTFSPNATTLNPTINASQAGTYTVTYTDNVCNNSVSAQILYVDYPHIFSDSVFCGETFQVAGTSSFPTGGTWTSTPNTLTFNTATSLNPLITAPQTGTYNVTYTDNICNNSVSSNLTFHFHPTIFPDTDACDYFYQVSGTYSSIGGTWSSLDTNIHFVPNNTTLNPIIQSSTGAGTYTVTFTDNACNQALNSTIHFLEYPWTQVNDTSNCYGAVTELACVLNPNNNSYVWNNGGTGNVIAVTEPGVYYVTVTNQCGQFTDSATVTGHACEINAPNIIVLSSTQGNNAWFINYDGIKEYHVMIVNRWEELIFESNDPKIQWNGQDKQGNVVSEGNYFYSLKATMLNEDVLEKQGFIQVYH